MLRIGITGQSGFIGTHLFNHLSMMKDNYRIIPFKDSFFESIASLKDFVSACDCIIHLAGLNRHNDPEIIYAKNLELVDKLIASLEETNSSAHVIFSSSSQEDRDNAYGRSKREGRSKLAQWAKKRNTGFTGLIIPNVFGPFGKPFYNSVISTFCHQLVNNNIPRIEIDGELKLIYISELVFLIENKIKNNLGEFEESFYIPPTYSLSVSGILKKLNYFKSVYFEHGIIPSLASSFDVNLFNTFRSYIDIDSYYPFMYKTNSDERGNFVELIKLYTGGQVSFSTIKPGFTRGNHFHTRKVERFAVIKGEAEIKMRKLGTDKILSFKLSGSVPSFVDMPVWYTHNIKNIGGNELVTVFWVNEIFNPEDTDTFYQEV